MKKAMLRKLRRIREEHKEIVKKIRPKKKSDK